VATIPSDKGSDIPPTPPTVDLGTKSARGSDGYWVSDFFIFFLGFFHSLFISSSSCIHSALQKLEYVCEERRLSLSLLSIISTIDVNLDGYNIKTKFSMPI